MNLENILLVVAVNYYLTTPASLREQVIILRFKPNFIGKVERHLRIKEKR